jgi:hypothetical protein
MKLIKIFNHFWSRIFLSSDEIFLIGNLNKLLNQNTKGQNRSSGKSEINILIQMPEDYFYIIKFYLFYVALRQRFDAVNVEMIQVSDYLFRKGKVSFVMNSFLYDLKWNRLFKKLFNGKIVFNFNLKSSIVSESVIKESKEVFSALRSKEDVLKIKCQNYKIGCMIYDYYLRVENVSTVDIHSPVLLEIIINAIRSVNELEEKIIVSKYDYFLTSYLTYTPHGIPAMVAMRKKVRIFSFGVLDRFCFEVFPELFSHVKNFTRYKNYKDKLTNNELKIAEEKINERFNGIIDSSTSYMRNSSYSFSNCEFRFDSSKPIVVIFLHCFFDSPHIYRDMLFPDFYEWLKFTLLTLSNNPNVNFYLKKHPNALEGNDTIINKLIEEFPKAQIIPADFNNLQIAKQMKPIVTLTVYGTVAHEMGYLGIPVVCAGDNPHIDFLFQRTPKSISEYRTILEHIHQTFYPEEDYKDVMRQEVLRFYYLHNLYPFLDSINDAEICENDVICGLYRGDGLKKINDYLSINSFGNIIKKLNSLSLQS